MTGPSIVTPQEAERMLSIFPVRSGATYDLAHTVATEPDRIVAAERAAVVKALRDLARRAMCDRDSVWITKRADAIENGAPL